MLSEVVVNIVHDVTEVVEDVKEIKEVHFIHGVPEFYQTQELEDDCNSQADAVESTNNFWLTIKLHLGNEAANEADHVKSEQPSKVGLGTLELRVDDSLESNVVLDVISELAVDLGDDFLNGWWLVRCQWFSCSDGHQLSKEV